MGWVELSRLSRKGWGFMAGKRWDREQQGAVLGW